MQNKIRNPIVWPSRSPVCIVALCLTGLFIGGYSVRAQDSLDRDYASELPRIQPTPATNALTEFEIDPQLEIRLAAAEPLVADPVAIDFDEWGRAFVCEMRGYSLWADDQLGRIRLLTDEDRDGQFDVATVFADGLRWPTGIVCVAGGVLVADAPDLILFLDTDGDGQADVRSVLFTGFGTENVQRLPNSLQWGPDLQIHGSSGGSGGRLQAASDRKILELQSSNDRLALSDLVDINGRDFRFDRQSMRLLPTSGGGQYGMTFDDHGTRYVCSNSDHCQQIVIEERYLARNPLLRVSAPRVSIAAEGPAAEVFRISEVEPWRLVRTRLRVQGLVAGPIEGGGRAAGYFTSATGITYYDGDALPETYRGNLFIGDVGSNLVHRKQLINDRLPAQAVRADQNTEFLRSGDNWFRPVQFAGAPDGSLIVLDMYRETVEHPASLPPLIAKHLDLASGSDRGRIYRIVPRGFVDQPRTVPGSATAAEWVEMLDHDNGWHRRTAARLLFEQSPEDIDGILRNQAVTARHSQARQLALRLLAARSSLQPDDWLRASHDPAPGVRVAALRLAESFQESLPVVRRLCHWVDDPAAPVQFQLALTLGEFASHLQDPSVPAALVRLCQRATDNPWISIAAATSVARCRSEVFRELAELAATSQLSSNSRRLFIELASEVAIAGTDDEINAFLECCLPIQQHDGQLAGELLVAVTTATAPQKNRFRTQIDDPDSPLSNSIRSAVSEALRCVGDQQRSLESRLAAIDTLRMATDLEFSSALPQLIDLRQAPEIRRAAVRAAGEFDSPALAQSLLPALPTMNPTLRSETLRTLVSRPSWARMLVEAIVAGRLDAVIVDASSRQALLHHPDEQIAAQAQSLFAQTGGQQREQIVQQYAVEIERCKPDAPRGREIFRRICAACHRLENEGNEIGPNLAAFANRGTDAILQNLFDPNREIDPRYLSYALELEDGRTVAGVIASESAHSITLHLSDGQSLTVLRDQIESMRNTSVSLMPENLENELSPQDTADLIAYLISQRG